MGKVTFLDTREQCEALVQGPVWMGKFRDRQCSRLATQRREELFDVILCEQHMQKALRNEELTLTEERKLIITADWSEDGQRLEVVFAGIIEAVYGESAETEHDPILADVVDLDSRRASSPRIAPTER
jgi:hypothetical protein